MSEITVALSKHNVLLEYKKDKPVPAHVFRTMQVGLDFLDASYATNSLVLHVSSELALSEEVGNSAARFGYHEYERSDYGILIAKFNGIDRLYTIAVEEEKIPYVDDMISRHRKMREFTVEVNHQSLLLDNEGRRTPFSYSTKMIWPIIGTLFWWADIAEPSKESTCK
jgi:hypothetical protein